MTYHIGQVLPYIKPRGILSDEEIPPTWYALTVPPQKERATREYFRARDIYAFYPSQAEVRTIKGKARKIERPITSQHVYAIFRHRPNWDVMKEQRRLITGVYGHGDQPIAIHRDIIRHLQGLTVEAERLREARAEMLRVRPGDKATVVSGPLSGFVVDVTSVRAGQAWFSFMTGTKASGDIATLERVVPDGG